MERFVVLSLVCLSLLIVGCRTAGTPTATSTDPHDLVDVSWRLQLVDGTPVPGAELLVQCAWFKGKVRTDRDGRFSFKGAPGGQCQIYNKQARVDQMVRIGPNLLRGTNDAVVTVRPVHRHLLLGNIEVDESLHVWNKKLARASVRTNARAWMPVPYRRAPRGGEIKKVPLLDPKDRLVALNTSAERTLVYLLSCNKKSDPVLGDLLQLSPVPGLNVVVIAPPICATAKLPRTVLRGSDEVLWALTARPGDLVLLDRDGAVQNHSRSGDPVAFLAKSWPPFAAARQVSVLNAHSVRIAEAARLITQAANQVRASRYAAAHGLVSRALQLDPEHAEAHRQRAILKARLGDVSGAMREVSWWRTSFGEESADDLLDEIQKVTASR